MIAQFRAKVGGDRFRDLDGRKLDGALSKRVPGERRNGDATAPAPRSRSALTSRFLFIRSARHIQQALLPGLNTGPTRGKMPEGWTSTQGVPSDKCCRFNSNSRPVEIIAHQRDGQVGGALDDANAQLAQRGAEFRCPLHVD